MLKRIFPFLIVFFSYTLVLGHSIIPHHHHNDEPQAEQSSHHNDDHSDDDQESDSGLAHSLSNYHHSGTTGDIHQQPEVKITDDTLATVYILAAFHSGIRTMDSQLPVAWPSVNHIPVIHHCLSSTGFRAPPFIFA